LINRRIEQAIGEIESEQVQSGVTICKLYNHIYPDKENK